MNKCEIERGMEVLRRGLAECRTPDTAIILGGDESWTMREIVEALEKRVAGGYCDKGDILDHILKAASS